MGGKHKQAQRTKNNARPSSSGRSAELLGSNLPSFSTFSCVKDFTLPLTSLNAAEDVEAIDTNFQLVFKKMNKKDATTKLKALQEFLELVKNSEPDAVIAVLPFWPRLYCSLAMDTEHRVREACHLAHHQVVLKVKRNIAPYLKQLAGAWFTLQYDTYAPAAQAAKTAFESAFPANKHQEAIVFCQEEILNYISDNLALQNAQSLVNAKTLSPEELEAKYERVIISSLQGYSLYLNKVNAEAVEKARQLNEEIVKSNKFWKLAKHKVPPIRSAWFEAVSTICSKAPFLLENNHVQLTSVIFNSLNETEPTVMPKVWEAVLLTVTTVPDWSTFINMEKVFIPKLWKILREGGQGSAVLIYRNLLPLISNLPNTIDLNAFYVSYFDNMRVGLKQKNVLSSRSEKSAIVTAYVECMQYIIMKNQSDLALCEKLIKTQLIPLLEWTLIESNTAPKVIFTQITLLVQYWNRNRTKPDLSNYSKYLEYFWNNTSSLFQGLLMNFEFKFEMDGVSNLAERQVEFLLTLKQQPKIKEYVKVSFEAGEVHCERNKADSSFELDDNYMSSLNKLVYQICEAYVKFINEKQCKELICYLLTLVQEYDGELFFKNMQLQLLKNTSSDSLLDVHKNLFSKWLKSSYLSSVPVVDLTFLLLLKLNDGDKKYVLNEINELKIDETFANCVAKSLSHPYNTNDVILNWLRSDKVSNFFISIVEEDLLKNECQDKIIILKQSLHELDSGDLFISIEALKKIVTALSQYLVNEDNYIKSNLDDCVSLASHIASIIHCRKFAPVFKDELLLSLFALSCNIEFETDVLSEDTLWEANTAWEDGINILSEDLPYEEYILICKKIANILEKYVMSDPWSNLVSLNAMRKISGLFISCRHSLNDIMPIFFDRDYIKPLKQYLSDICCYSEYVSGNLSSPYKPINFNSEFNDIDELNVNAEKYFAWRNVIMQVLQMPMEEDCSYIHEEIPNRIEIALDIFYDVSLLEILTNTFNNLKNHTDLCDLLKEYKASLSHFQHSDREQKDEQLINNVFKENWIWVKASRVFYENNMIGTLSVPFGIILSSNKDSDNLGKLQLIQTYHDVLTYDDVNLQLDNIEKIITLRCLLHCDEIEVQIAEVFNIIAKYKNGDMKQTFHEVDFSNWNQIVLINEIIHMFSTYINKKNFDDIPSQQWDFMVISLASWISSVDKIKSKYATPHVQAFIIAVLQFFCDVSNCITNVSPESSKKNRINEWKDVFEQSVHNEIVKVWYYLCGEFSTEKFYKIENVPLLKIFAKVLLSLESKYIFERAVDGTPKWSKILKTSLPLLIHSNSYLQIWGYRMLITMTPGFMDVDAESVKTNTPHEKGLILAQFKDILIKIQDIVQTMLLDFKLGENSCQVKPYTDSYTYVFAYFLLWDVILSLCEKASTELIFQYSDWLKKDNLLNNLLTNVFKLLPAEVFNNAKSKEILTNFTCRPKLYGYEANTSEKLEHLVCWIYSYTLLNLPASVRQWWTDTEPKTAQVIESVTSDYLSLHLCNQELTAVELHENNFKNMSVKVLKSIRTVKATYTVDESQMELLITLPTNYPLGGPDVQCNREIGGTSHKQWLMQLKMCLLHQNGRIWDGLSLWNHNLDKRFDGVEECYICFAVLHPGTYQLPKLSCHTCRKKFHSACLYKWFSTSNKSTCPICRNLF